MSALSIRGRKAPLRVAGVVLLIGLLLTAAAAWTSSWLYERNEDRLLSLRARELSLVLREAVPSIQAPLASAAELADITNGNVERFKALIAPEVGKGRAFASVSLWPLNAANPQPIAIVGETPSLATEALEARKLLAIARSTPLMHVTGMLASSDPKLAYEYDTPRQGAQFAVYAVSPLPKDRRLRLGDATGLSGLHYAIYLGRSRRNASLMLTDVAEIPAKGRQSIDVVPVGDNTFTLVVTPSGSLGGDFFRALPWIIAVTGFLLALAAAAMTDRLVRRRLHAEALARVLDRAAEENRERYTEQLGIAETLQRALLPTALPHFDGLQTSARYVPAASGIEVGGDWYDVVIVGAQQALLVIGDVSGHGLEAASTMAALRHAALAYATLDPRPATILQRLSDFVNHGEHDYFATVLCALLDADAHVLTVASAGHLTPLLIDDEHGARFLELEVGVPIGVSLEGFEYAESSLRAPSRATLLAFTDGLVERRGEILDVGMERLRAAAVAEGLPLEDLLEKLVSELASAGDHDDTAILGARWTN